MFPHPPHRVGVLFRKPAKLPPYERAVREVGLDPVRITPGEPLPLDGLSGLLFTGGSDVNPARYGADREPGTEEIDDGRDELESQMMQEAFGRDLPLFCICRGIQLMNVVCGGALIQHLDGHRIVTPDNPGRPAHSVDVVPQTMLHGIFGADRHEVNSRHHQAVDRLGAGLIVSARAGGVIEAIELAGKRFALGVQWHPEDSLENPLDRRLFEAFSNAVKSR